MNIFLDSENFYNDEDEFDWIKDMNWLYFYYLTIWDVQTFSAFYVTATLHETHCYKILKIKILSTNSRQQLFSFSGVLLLITDFHWMKRFSMRLKNELYGGRHKISCPLTSIKALIYKQCWNLALSIITKTFSNKKFL